MIAVAIAIALKGAADSSIETLEVAVVLVTAMMMAVTAVVVDGRLPLVAASMMLVAMAVTGAAMVVTGAVLCCGGCGYSDHYSGGVDESNNSSSVAVAVVGSNRGKGVDGRGGGDLLF